MPETSNIAENQLAALPKFLAAGLNGDRAKLELLAVTVVRKLKNKYPLLAQELSSVLHASGSGDGILRRVGQMSLPIDSDTSALLLRINESERNEKPIFPKSVELELGRFINERQESDKLVAGGLTPPRSLLLHGPPGTGKTMFVAHMAHQLGLPLFAVDLSAIISSYLGKTGTNLRKVLDHSRQVPSILFLDEFDAVAKRRDDQSDVGELKRIVNVLLKEVEIWPMFSVLVAATNHPELLDRAIFRRFDTIIEVPLPGADERKRIIETALGERLNETNPRTISILVEIFEGSSPSDIVRFCNSLIRQSILDSKAFDAIVFENLSAQFVKMSAGSKTRLCKRIKELCGPALTIREMAALLKLSPSTVHHHLHKEE